MDECSYSPEPLHSLYNITKINMTYVIYGRCCSYSIKDVLQQLSNQSVSISRFISELTQNPSPI